MGYVQNEIWIMIHFVVFRNIIRKFGKGMIVYLLSAEKGN